MNESSLTHYARRRGDAPCKSDCNSIQLLIGGFELFGRRAAFSGRLRLQASEFLHDSGDRIFSSGLDHFAALEFIWIDVSDQLTQRLEMLSARDCLIVLFDERNRQVFGLQGKGLIIGSDAS